MTLTMRINGEVRKITSDPDTPLAYVLRDELNLKGTKLGCGLEQCGACAVLVEGQVALSCVTAIEMFRDKDITTIEGISGTDLGCRVQEAFVTMSAAQCGYCTAGLVVATTALLTRNPTPDRDEVKDALSIHLCRCGSHPRVLRAVEHAANS